MTRSCSIGRFAYREFGRLQWRCIASMLVVVLVTLPASADVVLEDFEPLLRLDLPGHTGEVRALAFSADSSRLISGGRDKLAMVWQVGDGAGGQAAPRLRDIVLRRTLERVIRWQIARGPRGAIQALAASPAGDPPVFAVAGYGAMGSTGEIVLVDARDGGWIKTLGGAPGPGVERPGHRQSVVSLEFTADGGWLLSQDLDGQAFAWKRSDNWRPVELAKREEERFDAAVVKSLLSMPPMRPLAALGKDRAALPELVPSSGAAVPTWKIRVIDLERPNEKGRLLSFEHRGVVTALSATPDGNHLVSADAAGRIALLDPAGSRGPISWEVKPTAEGLAIMPDGKRVVVAVAADLSGGSPRLETWDLAPLRRVASRSVNASVRALRVSPDGRWMAWSDGTDHSIWLERTAEIGLPEADLPAGSRRRLGGVAQRISRLAFSSAAADAKRQAPPADEAQPLLRQRNIAIRKQQPPEPPGGGTPPTRIAVSRGVAGADGPPQFDAAFDIMGLAMSAVRDEKDWAPAAGRPGGWTIRPDSRPRAEQPPGVQRWELLQEGRPSGFIDLALDWQGPAGGGPAVSWLAKRDAATPWAVALGTDVGIFVYKLAESGRGPCRLIRWFRGNENRVLALAVSEDGRWLASGGGDGITMLWSLSGLDREAGLSERWGVDVRVENGKAVVESVDEAGPLVGRDVRVGDVIAKISFASGRTGPRTEHTAGDAIRAALADLPWNTSVTFTVDRGGNSRAFNRNPAWENIAAVHLADEGEWAFWSPRGYYAASANGDRMFGWLVNRGIDRLPRFFRANQFRRRLERPDVVSRLLAEGSLDAALRATAREVPAAPSAELPQQIRETPEVRIVSPKPIDVARNGRLAVRAEVEVPDGVEIDRVKAHVSGVPAAARPRVVEDVAAAKGRPRRMVYEWELDLPEQDRHLVSVFAAARQGPTESKEVTITADSPRPQRRPRLHVVASGVGRYANAPQWIEAQRARGGSLPDDAWDLLFPTQDAVAIRDALAGHALDLYDLGSPPILLAEGAATRGRWKDAVAKLAAELKDTVKPDDIVILFLSGHGLRNMDAAGAYAYLCHDAELTISPSGEDFMPTSTGSIGWADLQPLADLPCRKLALVDTCHSGALGPAGRSTSVREFQDDMIVVFASAEDDQPSVEHESWGHGAFTKALLEGLGADKDDRGQLARADGMLASQQPDGVVTVDELIAYVMQRVPKLTEEFVRPGGIPKRQTPKASPTQLLDYVRPPLVTVVPTPR
jgi:WD40 repeat protein